MRWVQCDLERGKQDSRDKGVEKDGDSPLAGVEETLSLRTKAEGIMP